MNLYEVALHGTESIYLLASTKYRALRAGGRLLCRRRSAGHTTKWQVRFERRTNTQPWKMPGLPSK